MNRLFSAYITYIRSNGQISPDLFVKIVHDLDTLLFMGTLHHRIVIRWGYPDKGGDLAATTDTRANFFWSRKRPLVTILLSKDMYREDSRKTNLGTLIHEMLHAHVHITTENRGEEKPTRHFAGGSHGPQFMRSARSLVLRLDFPGFGSEYVMEEEKMLDQ